MRLAKYIAHCGITSRRKAEKLIRSGKIKIDHQVITDVTYPLKEKKEKVYYLNQLITPKSEKVYLALYKPRGYISTTQEKYDEKIVLDFIPPHLHNFRLYPVGRLDKFSEGLIFLTNDGKLTNYLTHPSYKVEKEYLVTTSEKINFAHTQKIKQGINLEEGLTKVKGVTQKDSYNLQLILIESKKRQIRRMLQKIGLSVKKLIRIRVGKYKLGSLKSGQIKEITKENIV